MRLTFSASIPRDVCKYEQPGDKEVPKMSHLYVCQLMAAVALAESNRQATPHTIRLATSHTIRQATPHIIRQATPHIIRQATPHTIRLNVSEIGIPLFFLVKLPVK